MLVVALVLITGGLHLDGLMDTCDGLWGGHSAEQRLAIMRDSRIGSYGALGGASVLHLLKVAALAALPGPRRRSRCSWHPPWLAGRWCWPPCSFRRPGPAAFGATFRDSISPARLTFGGYQPAYCPDCRAINRLPGLACLRRRDLAARARYRAQD